MKLVMVFAILQMAYYFLSTCLKSKDSNESNFPWPKKPPKKQVGVSKNRGTQQIIHFNRVFH